MSGISPPSYACGLSGANPDTDAGSEPRAAVTTREAGVFYYLFIQVKFDLTSQVNSKQIPFCKMTAWHECIWDRELRM